MRQLPNARKTGCHCSGAGEVRAVILRLDSRQRAQAKESRALAAEGRTAHAADCSPLPHASWLKQGNSFASHSDVGALATNGRTARDGPCMHSSRRLPSKNDFALLEQPCSLQQPEDLTPSRSPYNAAADLRHSISRRAANRSWGLTNSVYLTRHRRSSKARWRPRQINPVGLNRRWRR